jgi:hypothetical protein
MPAAQEVMVKENVVVQLVETVDSCWVPLERLRRCWPSCLIRLEDDVALLPQDITMNGLC